MQQLKRAKRIVNNMRGAGYQSQFGDNKPQFYEVNSMKGGDINTNIQPVTDNQLAEAKKDLIMAEENLAKLRSQDAAYDKHNYHQEEAKCDTAKKDAKQKLDATQAQEEKMVETKCESYNKLKGNKTKQVPEESSKKESVPEESVKSNTQQLQVNISKETQNAIQDALKTLAGNKTNTVATPSAQPSCAGPKVPQQVAQQAPQQVSSNKLPFNILYVDKALGTAMNGANAAQPGVSVFSGGGNLYFMDSKTNKIYNRNTRSKHGKNLIENFLKQNKMEIVKQNGGHLLTQNGKLYLTKDKETKVSVGGGDFNSKNLGHVYQTQGGARKQNRKSNRKQNKQSNRKQNKKSNRKQNKQSNRKQNRRQNKQSNRRQNRK
jgi:hypothetical protein